LVLKSYRDVKLSHSEFAETLRRVAGKLNYTGGGVRYRIPGLVEIDENSFNELYVLGDVHGDYSSVKLVFETIGIPEKLGTGVKLVFLGDYVDRGSYQVETLALLLELKDRYPGDVILLRGNHEPPRWLLPYPHDLPYRVSQYFGPEKSSEALHLLYKFFDKLPVVAVLPGEAVLLHGGPPFRTLHASTLEEAFSVGDPMLDDLDLETVLWSDPVDEETYLVESVRGAGFFYGQKFTDKFLKIAGVKLIIRGHEAVEGYRINHERRVITVFSAPTPYHLGTTGLLRIVKTGAGFKYELMRVGVISRRVIDKLEFESY